MVDQIRVYEVLKVSPLVVGEEHVDCFGLAVAAPVGGDAVVDAVDDAVGAGEELVGFDFFHGLGDRLGAEGTAYLFEREEGGCGCVLDEVDVGESALSK